MNYCRFLTAVSKARKPSILREMTSMLAKSSSELVFLAGGLPNPSMFPFDSATINLKNGKQIALNQTDMKTALQYGPTLGYDPLLKFLKTLTEDLHKPPNWANSELIVTSGSQDGLCKTFEMLVEHDDIVLVQEPCYTGTLAILNPLTSNLVGVESDKDGLLPESLLQKLSKWTPEECSKAEKGVPKVLYLNPVGNNPTGSVMTEERRKEVYDIACRYNLLLLEDDPYYFVNFSDKTLPKSFLNLDHEGRVLRFDSFSKVLSSGLRLGYVSGPQPLVHRIMLHMQVSVLHASFMSQVLVSKLLEDWGQDGFMKHTKAVQEFYRSQRDAVTISANKHLSDLCEWSVPEAGMFLWMKVPSLVDTQKMVMEKGLANDVLVVPGSYFMVNSSEPYNYIRVAFSVNSPERMDLGLQRLAAMIKAEGA